MGRKIASAGEAATPCDYGLSNRMIALRCDRFRRRGSGPLAGTISSAPHYARMDDLIKRADQAIGNGHRIRGEARERLMQTRMTVAQIRGTLQQVRSEGAKASRLELETADRYGVFQENPADSASSGRRV